MVQLHCPAQKCLDMGPPPVEQCLPLSGRSAIRVHCNGSPSSFALPLSVRFLKPSLQLRNQISDRAVRWQRSVSQSSDRWTTFALGGLRMWQQDLGITIRRFSHQTVRSNSESVEPRIHWRSQTRSMLQSRTVYRLQCVHVRE